MRTDDLRLSPDERRLLAAPPDPTAVQRHQRRVVLSGVVLAVALLVTSPLIQSWPFLLFFAVAYIAVSTWERIRCARTILTYRELVRKLSGYPDAEKGSAPTSRSGS